MNTYKIIVDGEWVARYQSAHILLKRDVAYLIDCFCKLNNKIKLNQSLVKLKKDI